MGIKISKICACENEKNNNNFEQNLSNKKQNVIKINNNKQLLIIKSRNFLNKNNFNSSIISTSFENKNFDSTTKEIHYKNGDFYKGEILVKNNQKIKNGKGKYFFNIQTNNNFENKEYFYEGEFQNDKFHGKGILNLPNLNYEGNFVNGFKNGKGTLKDYKNDLIYTGEFLNDVIQGEGTETNNKNKTKYVGFFIDNKKNGKGKLYFNINNNNNEYYEGNFKNDKFNGKGIYFWNESKFCIGNWKNNVLKGFVKFYEKNEIFFGFFNENKKEGLGMIFYKENKLSILSHWINDLIEGLAIFASKEKGIEYFEMKNNKKIHKLNLIEINNNIEKLDEFRRLKEYYFCLEQNDELKNFKDFVKLFNE